MTKATLSSNEKINKLKEILGITGKNINGSFGAHEAARKLVYHQRNFSAFLEGRYSDITPISVEIVPSLECNFKCPGCTYNQNGAKDSGSIDGKPRLMSRSALDYVLEGLESLGVKSVIVTGGGEPFMNKDTLEYMARIEKKFRMGLYTNAALIGDKIDAILQRDLVFIRMSLNSGDRETHSLIYGVPGLFETVVQNISSMGRRKKALNKDVDLGIGFILSDKNGSEEQIRNIGYTLLRINEQSNGGINYAAIRPEVQYFTDDREICTQQPNPEAFRFISERVQRLVIEPLKGSGMVIVANIAGLEQLANDYKDGPNIATAWSVSINYDGKMYAASEANGSPKYCMTNVPGEPYTDTWHGERRRDLVRRMESLPSDPGHIKLFPNFKLSVANEMLQKIKALGTFTPLEVKEFYDSISLKDPSKHIDFV